MKNTDTLLEAARALITSAKLDENVDNIKSLVSTVKVGDSTNFGKVLEIGANSITFKAKDLPKTTIPFNARKMGSRDYVLDKLIKLKEALDPNDDAGVWIDDFVKSDNPKFSGKSKEERIKMALGAWYAAQKKENLSEEVTSSDIKIVLDAAKKIGGKITGNTIDFGMGAVIKVSVEGGKIKFDGGKSSGIEHFDNVNDAVMAFESIDSTNSKTLEEETMSKGLLKNVLRIMETQSFSDWYKEDFEGYITGDPDAKTEEEILDDLESIFKKGYPMR